MSSLLIEQLTEKYHYPLIDESTLDEFLQTHHEAVLFFTENPVRYPESNDVAVILPELMKLYGSRLAVAVVSREAEIAFKPRFGVRQWPSLVFVRDGEVLGVIGKVRNWDEYQLEIDRVLAGEARPMLNTIAAVNIAD